MRQRARRQLSRQRVGSPGWHAVAAAVVGRAHESDGQGCQDAVACIVRPGFAATVLADGAGSAPLAREGAQGVTAALAAWLADNWPRLRQASENEIRHGVLGAAAQAVLDMAERYGCAPGDLACTLLWCACDGETLIASQLGDGRVGVHARVSGDWSSLFEPTRGEFANETVFLTSSGAADALQVRRLRSADVDACVLMSDGADASLFQRSSARFAPALQSLHVWAAQEAPPAFQAALERNLRELLRQRTHDDVSVALLLERVAR